MHVHNWEVWRHFKVRVHDKENAFCKICLQNKNYELCVVRSGGGPTNLDKHLDRWHSGVKTSSALSKFI